MNIRIKKLFISLLLTLSSIALLAQGQMYTRKVKLEDFPVRTTKVVLGGSSFLDMRFKEEMNARWRISAFEFCTPQDYEQLKNDNSYYFITMAADEGVAFLILSKGGREDDENNLKKPFEVVRIPIASIDNPSGQELLFMGSFIDIIQTFVEEAMASDKIAYAGLKHYNSRKLTGKRVYVDPEDVDRLYAAAEPNALLGISIAPSGISFRSHCYRMLISADTHELYYYNKSRYKGSNDARFTEQEIKQFDKRNGIIPR